MSRLLAAQGCSLVSGASCLRLLSESLASLPAAYSRLRGDEPVLVPTFENGRGYRRGTGTATMCPSLQVRLRSLQRNVWGFGGCSDGRTVNHTTGSELRNDQAVNYRWAEFLRTFRSPSCCAER